ncbi:hypothetical protein [Candidatus Pantoea multigeneris]|uniref:Uncharacterized protein n=1 Tax=Candidatus Pantoea multigeneris TaxID=2608357 RepID=A0ABX0RF98_9GAMM|nr:hypothetical protein [Pantoea multigeneris]NIF24037.1 hypothetical protein [Pantoea multigeneris]
MYNLMGKEGLALMLILLFGPLFCILPGFADTEYCAGFLYAFYVLPRLMDFGIKDDINDSIEKKVYAGVSILLIAMVSYVGIIDGYSNANHNFTEFLVSERKLVAVNIIGVASMIFIHIATHLKLKNTKEAI